MSGLLAARAQDSGGNRVEISARGIDVGERQWACVRAVRKQYKNSFRLRLNPERCSGKAEMPEAVFL